jgi:hypothetical protein
VMSGSACRLRFAVPVRGDGEVDRCHRRLAVLRTVDRFHVLGWPLEGGVTCAVAGVPGAAARTKDSESVGTDPPAHRVDGPPAPSVHVAGQVIHRPSPAASRACG